MAAAWYNMSLVDEKKNPYVVQYQVTGIHEHQVSIRLNKSGPT